MTTLTAACVAVVIAAGLSPGRAPRQPAAPDAWPAARAGRAADGHKFATPCGVPPTLPGLRRADHRDNAAANAGTSRRLPVSAPPPPRGGTMNSRVAGNGPSTRRETAPENVASASRETPDRY